MFITKNKPISSERKMETEPGNNLPAVKAKGFQKLLYKGADRSHVHSPLDMHVFN